MIELQHISKRFGALAALDDVSLTLSEGSILGLLGENGAGKSTLMNILFGLLRPTSGRILVRGVQQRIPGPHAAARLGIGMVHQHFKLVPSLNGLENLALFLPGKAGRSLAEVRRLASAALEQLRWSLPLERRADDLTVGQQQRLEIIKALLTIRSRAARGGLLILDEPTAVLTPREVAELFAAARHLRDRQGAGIVLITHKLAEVPAVCDQVAVLRRGRLVHTDTGGIHLPPDALAEKMVGARVDMPSRAPSPASPPAAPAAPLLALHNVSAGMLKDVSLDVHAGEIVGIAGVDGNGQRDLALAILGLSEKPPSAGGIELEGRPAGPVAQRLLRIALIAEDRQREALILPLSLMDNLLLKDYRRPPYAGPLGWLRFGQWRRHAAQLVQAFDIRTPSIQAPVGRLSGGNQQKAVLARELHHLQKPIVLAFNPTRGLDIGATAFVLQQLLDARGKGAAVLLIHSDLDELLAISDRVAVLYNGRLLPTSWPHCSRDDIGRRMLGLDPAPIAAAGKSA